MTEPVPVPQNAKPNSNPRGSLLLGVACAWGLLIGGYAVVAGCAAVLAGMPGSIDDATAIFLGLLPWLGMLALIVWFAVHGRSRSAIGVAVGIASIIAVVLLLVAACFGLLSSGGWH